MAKPEQDGETRNFSLPPDLPTVEGKPGDKFSFTNDTGKNQTFIPASCLSPSKNESLTTSGEGQTTRPYTINNGTPPGEYRYSIDDGVGSAGLRTGRIIVT